MTILTTSWRNPASCFPASLLPASLSPAARLAALSPEGRSAGPVVRGSVSPGVGWGGRGGGVPPGHAQGACPGGTPPPMPHHPTPGYTDTRTPGPAERPSGLRGARRVRVSRARPARPAWRSRIFGRSRPVGQNRLKPVPANDWIGSRSRRPQAAWDVQDLVGLSLGRSTGRDGTGRDGTDETGRERDGTGGTDAWGRLNIIKEEGGAACCTDRRRVG